MSLTDVLLPFFARKRSFDYSDTAYSRRSASNFIYCLAIDTADHYWKLWFPWRGLCGLHEWDQRSVGL
jgi:hypothetical protein